MVSKLSIFIYLACLLSTLHSALSSSSPPLPPALPTQLPNPADLDSLDVFPSLTPYPRRGIAPLYPFHTNSTTANTTSANNREKHYSILIDAGSTGSRISIYSFTPRTITVPVSQCTSPPSSSQTPSHCTSSPQLQTTPIQPFSTPSTSTLFSKKVTPGLHTVFLESVQTSTASIYNDNDDNEHTIIYDTTIDLTTLRTNLRLNLSPLLSFAIDKFNEMGIAHQIPYTPLFLLCTGGVRSLLEDERKILLQITQEYLSSTGFYIDPQNHAITTVSGELEGLFGWISVNYLLSNSTIFNPTALSDQQGEVTAMFEEQVGKSYGGHGRNGNEAENASKVSTFHPSTATDLLNNPNISSNHHAHDHRHGTSATEGASESAKKTTYSPPIPPQLLPPRPVGVIDLGGATLQLALAENSASTAQNLPQTDSTSFLSSYPFQLGHYKAQCFVQCFWYYGKDTSLYRIHNILYNVLYSEEIWQEQQSFLKARGTPHLQGHNDTSSTPSHIPFDSISRHNQLPANPSADKSQATAAQDAQNVMNDAGDAITGGHVHRPLIKSVVHFLEHPTKSLSRLTNGTASGKKQAHIGGETGKKQSSSSKTPTSRGNSDDSAPQSPPTHTRGDFVDRGDSLENEQYLPIEDDVIDTDPQHHTANPSTPRADQSTKPVRTQPAKEAVPGDETAEVTHWTKKQLPHHWKTTVNVTKYQNLVEYHNSQFHSKTNAANRLEFDNFLRFVHNNPTFKSDPVHSSDSSMTHSDAAENDQNDGHFDFTRSSLPKPPPTAPNGKKWSSLTRNDLSDILNMTNHADHVLTQHDLLKTRLFNSPCLPRGYETQFHPYSQFLTPLDPKHPINTAKKMDGDPANDNNPLLKPGQPFGTDIMQAEYAIYILGQGNFDECYQLAKQLVISRTTTPCYNTDPQMVHQPVSVEMDAQAEIEAKAATSRRGNERNENLNGFGKEKKTRKTRAAAISGGGLESHSGSSNISSNTTDYDLPSRRQVDALKPRSMRTRQSATSSSGGETEQNMEMTQVSQNSVKDQSSPAPPSHNTQSKQGKVSPPFTAQCTSFFGQYKPAYDENTPFYLFSGFGYLGKWLNLTTTATTIPNYHNLVQMGSSTSSSSKSSVSEDGSSPPSDSSSTVQLDMVYATPAVNVTYIMMKGREICQLSETELLLLYPNEPKYLLHRYCWFSAYITALLHDGFRFGLDSNNIHFVSNVANTDVTYSAGAMVYLANQLPYYVQYNVSNTAQSGSVGMNVVNGFGGDGIQPHRDHFNVNPSDIITNGDINDNVNNPHSPSSLPTILISSAVAMVIGILGTALVLQYFQLQAAKRDLKANHAKWLHLQQDKYKSFGYNNHTPNYGSLNSTTTPCYNSTSNFDLNNNQQQQQQQQQHSNQSGQQYSINPSPMMMIQQQHHGNSSLSLSSQQQQQQQPNFLHSPSLIQTQHPNQYPQSIPNTITTNNNLNNFNSSAGLIKKNNPSTTSLTSLHHNKDNNSSRHHSQQHLQHQHQDLMEQQYQQQQQNAILSSHSRSPSQLQLAAATTTAAATTATTTTSGVGTTVGMSPQSSHTFNGLPHPSSFISPLSATTQQQQQQHTRASNISALPSTTRRSSSEVTPLLNNYDALLG